MRTPVPKILALDIGEKRIGVAIADRETPFATPLTTLQADNNPKQELKELIKKHRVSDLVVGLPRNQSGGETAQTQRVRKIVSLLGIPKSVNLYWQDESLTSVKAENELKKRKKHYEKADVDKLAATYILSDFIDEVIKKPKVAQPQAHDQPEKEHSKSANSKKNKKKPKKLIKTLVWLLIPILLALVLFGGYTWYQKGLSARTSDDVYHVVTVKMGATSSEIIKQLADKEVIRDQNAAKWYVKLSGISNLKAGSYRLSSKQSTPDILKTIEDGKTTQLDVLIPPGLRLDQIIKRIEKAGFSEQEIENAIADSRNHPLLKDLPKNTRLEGYLFPNTYKIGADNTAKQLITAILDTFNKEITPEIKKGIEKQGITLAQAIIIASIVQKEVPDAKTQKTVAQVFIKRLKSGQPLGADPTFKYAAIINNQEATPDLDSPYNTRKYTGLPPTAIANFNISALAAVAYPADTDYNYFVAGDDGKTYFSNTLAEHEALTREHCTKLCQ